MSSGGTAGRRTVRAAARRILSRAGYELVRTPVPAKQHKQQLPSRRPVRLVVATQLTLDEFHASTLLGRSLASIPKALAPRLTVYAENTGAAAQGLPALYNQALDSAEPGEVLVCVHDDVHLHDWHIVARAREAVAVFDVAGIAGARKPDLSQPSWYWSYRTVDGKRVRDARQQGAQSGSVNHGEPEQLRIQVHGPLPHPCELVDGVLMILDADRVRAAGARFDERFRFHFYDVDFSRTARARGLSVGTWPIAITHSSRGGFESAAFLDQADDYLEKWQDARQT